MAKRGRKSKQGVARTPSGQISRAEDAMNEHIGPIERRMARYGLSEGDARDQRSETVVGRLNMARLISDAQYQAAVEYQKLCAANERASSSPNSLRSRNAVGGQDLNDEQHARWCQAVIGKYKLASAVILRANERARGTHILGAMQCVVLGNQELPHLYGDAALGLSALAVHFQTEKA